MLRDAFEVSYTISGLDNRVVLFANVPLFKSGTLPSEGEIVGYGLMKIDSNGGNSKLLEVNPTDIEANLIGVPNIWERWYCGYRGESDPIVQSLTPVKVE